MIEAQDIKYEYIRRDDHDEVVAVETALNAVSFRIEAGQFVGIIGANGSGKSTLAKHLNALLIPEEGTVFVDGIDTSDGKMTFEVRSLVGMIFQNPDNQIVHDMVEDDVAFGPENLGVAQSELRSRVDEALMMVGMSESATVSPMRLSGGQKARVAIAGVLAMKPKCMVFDESTAMLDPAGREEVLREVRRLNTEEGITVIWITHFSEEVVGADTVFVMDEGELVLSGTPREVFSEAEWLTELGLSVPTSVSISRELGLPVALTSDELVTTIQTALYG